MRGETGMDTKKPTPWTDSPACRRCALHVAILLPEGWGGKPLAAEPPVEHEVACVACGHRWMETDAAVLLQAWRADVAWSAERERQYDARDAASSPEPSL